MSNAPIIGKICVIRNTITPDIYVFSLTPNRDLFKRFTQIKNLINKYKKDTDTQSVTVGDYSKFYALFTELGSDWNKFYVDIVEVVESCYTLRERLYYYSIRIGTLNANYIGLVPDSRLLKDNISVVSSTVPSRYNSVPNSPRVSVNRINTQNTNPLEAPSLRLETLSRPLETLSRPLEVSENP
jgi:hypothetical protein